MMSRFSTGVLTALVAGVMAVAPALADKKTNSIRFAYDQVAENVDPFMNNVRIGVIIGQQVWDTLIYRDPKTNEYKGQLATAWKWIDDKTLELELRQGVKFHNGEEFDADDVVYTLNFVVQAGQQGHHAAERRLDRARREARQVQGAHHLQASRFRRRSNISPARS